jgi:hypothetical protein
VIGVTLLVFCLLSGGATVVQAPVPDGQPLAVAWQGEGTDARGQSVVSFSLTNRSSKEMSAYALLQTTFDHSGKISSTRTLRSAVRGVMPLARPNYAPRETWTEQCPGPPRDDAGASLPYSLEVDYVRFVDGSSWGGDKSGSADYFRGVAEGARLVRSVLEDKLKTQGDAGVQSFLVGGALALNRPAAQGERSADYIRGEQHGSRTMHELMRSKLDKEGIAAVTDFLRTPQQ